MTGAAEADQEQQDAGTELLLASILMSLALLRFVCHLRQISAARLDELHSLIRAAIARADIAGLPGPYRPGAARRLADDLDATVAGIYGRLLRDLLAELEALAGTIVDHTSAQIDSAVGVDGAAVPVDRGSLGKAVAAALIVGAPISDWLSRQGGDLSFRLGRIVMDSARGVGPAETAASVRDAVASAQRAADTIVSTATTAVHGVATEAVIEANNGVTTMGTLWVSCLDGRTTPECRSRANLKWDADRNPIGHNKPYRIPPIHPNCRSSLIPWLMNSDDMPLAIRRRVEAAGRAGALSGKPPREPTLDEFLLSRPVSEQKSILGTRQHALWVAGKITTAGLLDQSSRPIDLRQLRRLLGLG